MTQRNIVRQQKYIIETIIAEKENTKLSMIKSSGFLNAVWFQMESGRFIFNDEFIKYEVIEPLIDCGTLKYSGIHKHQGDDMVKYILIQHD